MRKMKKPHHWTKDKDVFDQWADGLVVSFYGQKRVSPNKIIQKLNASSNEQWAAADYKVRMFFNKLYNKHGIKACEELCSYTNEFPLLRTILYSMLGHRYFDDGNLESMRTAYQESLKSANNIPYYAVHTNAEKWKFSTNFYWARHDHDNIIKEQCLIRIMSIPIKNFHHELIQTKFIRGLQWLMKNTNATEAIEKGKTSMKQFLKDGRITKEMYDQAFTTFPNFVESKPDTHDFEIGNP
jgi:hypothetical protein